MKKILLITLLSLVGFMFLMQKIEAYDYDEGTVSNGLTSTGSDSSSISPASCSDLGGLQEWLSNAFKFVQYGGIGLAVVLTAVDFVQVIGGSKDDDLKKAFDRTIKRLIAVVLLLLTTVLVNFIITTFIKPTLGDDKVQNCIK